ncbi:MAG: peptidoglycan recognition protein family protein [Clostridiales bacterium]|nr:peptidoglycan recognition protein family protein [Clostridiales bacterium]
MRTKRRTYQHSSRRHRLWPVLLALAVGLGLFLYTSDGLSPGTAENDAGEEPGIDLTSIFSRHKEPPETPDWVTVDLLTVNEYSRPGTELETVNGIVVHYVGNPGTTAQANRNYFEGLSETGETHASSHFVIGLEGEIIQCVPLDEIAYCSNDRNSDTISIECCHPGEDGAFTQETYDSLVKLVAFLADYYDLGRDQIIRHYDVTGKLCPLYYVEHEDAWEQFKDDVFGSE